MENQENNQDLQNLLEDSGFDHKPELEPRMKPVSAAILGLIGVFILYQFGGSILTIAIFGFDLKNADVTAVRLLTMAGQLLFILLPALLLSKMVYEDITEIIRFRMPKLMEIFLFSVGLILLNTLLQSYLYIQNFIIIKLADSFPVIEKVKSLLDQVDKMVEESYSTLLTSNSVFESIFIVFIVAVIPAVCEEVFFRGYVQKSFEFKYKAFTSALITAVFFGLYHFHPYQIIPLVALGFYFGFAVYKSNSIFVAVLMHFLNNLIAVIMFFALGSDEITSKANISFAEVNFSILVFLGVLILFSFLMVYLNRSYYKTYNQ